MGVRQKRLESTGRDTELVVQRTRGLAQCGVRSDFVELLRMWVEGGHLSRGSGGVHEVLQAILGGYRTGIVERARD